MLTTDVLFALGAALLGGLLLNLMPCVFPVLALKALGLMNVGSGSIRQRRKEAILFAAGGVGVLTLLGLVTALVSALGQRLDWGFSFQQPAFVWILALVFWVFTLQLWGVWSWKTSPFSLSYPHKAGPAQALVGGAFLVLAAAPCTGPFLGPALGFAFGLSPWFLPLFFGAVGVGLVLPILILLFFPGWARFLPKPGSWMVTFERTAGFFLAATVLYLLWVLTSQTDSHNVWPALAILGLVAGALALAGRTGTKVGGKILVGLLLLSAVVGSGFLLSPSREPLDTPGQSGWSPYSAQGLSQALTRGEPVLVDGTAAWCATCQVNELMVLNRPDVVAILERHRVVKLRADYTRPNAEVGAWLNSVGRAGLPVYVLYRPSGDPVIFPELLTDANFTKRLDELLGEPRGGL